MMCGGTGDEKPADADVQGHCDAVKADVEKHLGKTFKTFEAKSFKSQVSRCNTWHKNNLLKLKEKFEDSKKNWINAQEKIRFFSF